LLTEVLRRTDVICNLGYGRLLGYTGNKQKQLQKFLPGDGKSIPYSAVIWALQMPTDSYPMWYCAAIVGVNIIDLKAATNKELCAIVKKITGDPLNHAETGA